MYFSLLQELFAFTFSKMFLSPCQRMTSSKMAARKRPNRCASFSVQLVIGHRMSIMICKTPPPHLYLLRCEQQVLEQVRLTRS